MKFQKKFFIIIAIIYMISNIQILTLVESKTL